MAKEANEEEGQETEGEEVMVDGWCWRAHEVDRKDLTSRGPCSFFDPPPFLSFPFFHVSPICTQTLLRFS